MRIVFFVLLKKIFSVCVCVQMLAEAKEGVRPLGAAVTGGCEQPEVVAGIQ